MDASADVAKDSRFVSLVENSVCQGLINMQAAKKKGSMETLFDQRTFSLQVSEEDITSNFKDLPILKNLLP